MSQIKTKFIENLAVTTGKIANTAVDATKLATDAVTTVKILADAVTGAKIRLDNNQFLRGRNQANSGDISALKINTSDKAELGVELNAGTFKITNLGAPSSADDAATKTYVDTAVAGASVGAGIAKAASNTNVDVNNPGSLVFDSVGFVLGDKLFLFAQTASEENGLYVFDTDSTPLVRDTSWDTAAEFTQGREIIVMKGATYANTTWQLQDSITILGTDPVNFTLGAFNPALVPVSVLPYDDGVINLGSPSKNWSSAYINSAQVDVLLAKISANGVHLNDLLHISGNGGSGQNPIRFYESDDTNYVALRAPDTITTNVILTLPDNDGNSGEVLTTDGSGILSWTASSSTVASKETFTLNGTDITNQYIDLANVAETDSIQFIVKGGAPTLEGASHDYSVSYTGGAGGNTRITFLNDLATGGGAALVATDVVQIAYRF